jgi:hypothetical protein
MPLGQGSPEMVVPFVLLFLWTHIDRQHFPARPVRMTLDQLSRTGEHPTLATVKYPDGYGGGYMATLEVTHQLQCIVS